jgi:hypothetical protein
MSRTNHSTIPSPITSVVPLNPWRLAVAHGRKGQMKSFSIGVTDTDAPVSIKIGYQLSFCEQFTEDVADTSVPVIRAADSRAWW